MTMREGAQRVAAGFAGAGAPRLPLMRSRV